MAKITVSDRVKREYAAYPLNTRIYERKVSDLVRTGSFEAHGKTFEIWVGKVIINGVNWFVYWNDGKGAYELDQPVNNHRG